VTSRGVTRDVMRVADGVSSARFDEQSSLLRSQ